MSPSEPTATPNAVWQDNRNGDADICFSKLAPVRLQLSNARFEAKGSPFR